MHVLITGGTGALGRILVNTIACKGHSVRIMSTRGRTQPDPQTEWAQADLATGNGLHAALDGIDTVFHLASNPRNPEAVDVTGTRHLVAASRASSVRHLVFVSIVGIDDIPTRYYQRKQEAERIIAASGIPYSIQRATQFHSFIDMLLSKLARVPLVLPLPTTFRFQSVDESEVAQRLAACLDTGPGGRLTDFGGPDVLTTNEIARTWLKAKGIRKPIVHMPIPGNVAKQFRAGRNTAPEGVRGTISWQDWLQAQQDTRANPATA
jgi:uncharacterized protein YbjT (DUF2867 family)